MPTKGFRSLSVKETTMERLIEAYEIKKKDLIEEDIKSFSGYAQVLLEKAIDQDLTHGRFQIVARDGDTVIIKDHYIDRAAGVTMSSRGILCDLDERSDCCHVGFALSDAQVIKRARELDISFLAK